MLLPLTENYISSKFYQHCGHPSYNRSQKTYQGSCPICREGKSWLKKRRCFYIVDQSIVYCHNCGWSSKPYNWIQRVTGLSYKEIKEEIESSNYDVVFNDFQKNIQSKKDAPALPVDSINLEDKNQIDFYNTNKHVTACIQLVRERRLDTAVNRPQSFFTTLMDKVHLNRLILPFYDDSKVVFYQSREVIGDKTRPKYLSKMGGEKSLFGIDNVIEKIEYLFLTEGPIDAMFIQNGIGVAGINESKEISFTGMQAKQLKRVSLYKRVWVLDNQKIDSTSKTKTKHLLNLGESVFIWPEQLQNYKDINEVMIDKKINSFDIDFIVENTFKDLKGKLLIARY